MKFTKFLVLILLVSGYSMVDVSAQASPDEKSAVALYNEGLAALKIKDYVTGLNVIEAALAKAKAEDNAKVVDLCKKNGAVAAYYVGNDFLKSEKYDSAAVAFNRGIAINEEYGSNFLGIARCLEGKGSTLDAMNDYVKYAKMSTDDPKKAEDAFKRAKNMIVRTYNDKDYKSVAEVGGIYLANDKNGDVAYLVGMSQASLGNNEAAVMGFKQSIEYATAAGEATDDKVYYAMGDAYEALGKSAEAIEAFKKISDAKYKAQAEYKIGKLSGN